MDILDDQDLSAYVSNAVHCLTQTVNNVCGSHNIEPSKIIQQPRGFLGIS